MFFGDEFKALVESRGPRLPEGRDTQKKEGSHKQGKPAPDSITEDGRQERHLQSTLAWHNTNYLLITIWFLFLSFQVVGYYFIIKLTTGVHNIEIKFT